MTERTPKQTKLWLDALEQEPALANEEDILQLISMVQNLEEKLSLAIRQDYCTICGRILAEAPG